MGSVPEIPEKIFWLNGVRQQALKRRKFMVSLRQELLVFIALIIMLLVLMGASMYVMISKTELKSAVYSIRSLTRAMGERLDESSEAFKLQIDFVTLDGEIADNLKLLEQGSILAKDLRSIITLRIMSMDVLNGVYLYNLDGSLITKWMHTPNRIEAYQHPDQVDVNRYDKTGAVRLEFADGQVIYNRAIRTLEDWKVVAYISFVYDKEELRRKLNLFAGEQMQYLMLYDSTTRSVISSSGEDRESAGLEAMLQTTDPGACEDGMFLPTSGKGEMLICSTEVMNDGWFLVCGVERSQVFTGKTLILYITLIFVCLSLLFIAMLYYVIGYRIIRPLGVLSQAIRKVRDGNYAVELDDSQNNEIGMLAAGFNDMSDKIDELVNQNLKGEIAFQNMQLSMLRKQIEPHFLYNTLECINALAELGRSEDIRLLTIHFSRLMKTQMDEQQFCTIACELDCVESFLKIYKIIEGEKLDYQIQSDEECRDIVIPAYLIQPIVENAVVHGIRKSVYPGTCTVSVEKQGELVCIRVSDDGGGMPADIQEAIRAYGSRKYDEKQTEGLGIGLRNVIDRIWYIYKGIGTFSVYSDPEWGVSVEMILPIRKDLEADAGGVLFSHASG